MSNDLALPSVVTMTTTGLHIPEGISKGDWEEVGAALGQIDKRMQWMVGDWINAGEREGYISRDTYDAAERLFPQLGRQARAVVDSDEYRCALDDIARCRREYLNCESEAKAAA